ncbi:MAG: extracellular solute-binding protein [Planctomycetota bacterium]
MRKLRSILIVGYTMIYEHLRFPSHPAAPWRPFRGLDGRAARRLAVAFSLLMSGCFRSQPEETVVVYTALDEPFSRPVLERFTEQTGIAVRPKYDTESTKTVGLTQAIMAESARPICDVFWNNEILNTLRLQQKGLLAPSPNAASEAFPASFRGTDSTWHGFAARARVLLVNTSLVAEEVTPTSIYALTDPDWKGKCAIAKPLAGTTATHAMCLYTALGDEESTHFFRTVNKNARVLSGNKQVALAVAAGEVAFGLTDTDDAIAEVESGRPVAIVYPDQAEGELGTLFIPNTVARISGSPNAGSAQELVEFLLSPEVERMLASGPSAQIPLGKGVETNARVETPETIRAMEIDFEAAAARWDEVAPILRDVFAAPE